MAITQEQNYIHTGNIEFQSGIKITTGAGANKVATSDASGNLSWQNSGTGVILSATVTISSAQILAIHTTPITLVAAQGANTIIIPIRISYYLPFVTTPYATDTLTRAVIDPTGVNVNFGTAAVIGLSANAIVSATASNLSTSGSISSLFNSPLVLTTATSNPTAGDSTLKMTVLYSVVTI